MFRIVERPEFTHEVPVQVPVDGGWKTEKLKARFRILPDEELDTGDLTQVEASKEYLRRIIVRLEDLADEAGQPLDYSDEVRERVLALPYARLALMRAFSLAQVKAREGN